ncbi:MAG: IPT/TIG domain-containing protein, partial [Limisphaerales bacterium]
MMLRHFIRGWGLLALLASSLLASSPVITGFTPSVGSAGDTLMVTGSGFTSGGITFYFWQGIPAAYYINSDSQLTVIVPGGISTGPLGIQQGTGPIAYTPDDFIAIGPGPYISDFSPAYGAVGDLVTIDGAHLTNSPVVKFNGTASGEVSVNASGSQLTARVPTGATSGVITVTTSWGTANSPGSFLVIGAGPYVTGFSPGGGSAGLQIFVTGVHFTGVTNVSFGNQPGVSLAVTSDSQLQVATPSSVVSGALTLKSSLGTFTTSSNFYVPPSISSFSPANGRAGTNVTITGANFLGATSVKFGGLSAASFTVVNNTSLRATAPNGVTNGLIRVNTPMFSCFSASQFTVSPTISGFSPSFGPVGTSVTITGANLNAGTPSVWFNGVPAATPTGVSFGQITAGVPAGATTGPLTVSTSSGSTVSANNFLLPPSVSGFSPVAGGVGSRVTINGQNFLGA